MKNVETAMFPLLLLLCLCRLCVFEYPQGRPKLYLTILYVVISWPLYIYIAMRTAIFLDTFALAVYTIILLPIIVASAFIPFNIYYHKEFKSCLKRLDIVNDTLEKLGKLKNYAQLRAQTIWVIIGWLVSVFLTDGTDSLFLYTFIPKYYATISIVLPFIMNHAIHICTLYEIMFMTLLRYIESLFEYVNQCLEELIEREEGQVRPNRPTKFSIMQRPLTGTLKSNQLICILMHIHLELSSITRKLNLICELQMVMLITALHLSIIVCILEFYDNIGSIKIAFSYNYAVSIFCSSFWIAKCILSLVLFNHICEGVCTKANHTQTVLNRLSNVTCNSEMQKNIVQFLLKILGRPLRITGLGLYDYGYKLVYTITERVVKMIIIVVQARN